MDLELLTLRDVIDALMRYDIKHCPFPQNDISKKLGSHNGIIDDEKKIVYLNEEQTQESMRKTIIHEFSHAKNYRAGKKDTEKQIEKETEIIYKKLYGSNN